MRDSGMLLQVDGFQHVDKIHVLAIVPVLEVINTGA